MSSKAARKKPKKPPRGLRASRHDQRERAVPSQPSPGATSEGSVILPQAFAAQDPVRAAEEFDALCRYLEMLWETIYRPAIDKLRAAHSEAKRPTLPRAAASKAKRPRVPRDEVRQQARRSALASALGQSPEEQLCELFADHEVLRARNVPFEIRMGLTQMAIGNFFGSLLQEARLSTAFAQSEAWGEYLSVKQQANPTSRREPRATWDHDEIRRIAKKVLTPGMLFTDWHKAYKVERLLDPRKQSEGSPSIDTFKRAVKNLGLR